MGVVKRERAVGAHPPTSCCHFITDLSAIDFGNLLLLHGGQGGPSPCDASHVCCGCGKLVHAGGAAPGLGNAAAGHEALRGCACGCCLLLDVARRELYCCCCHDFVYLDTFDEGRQLTHVVQGYVSRGLSPSLPHHDPGPEVRAKRARAVADPALAALRTDLASALHAAAAEGTAEGSGPVCMEAPRSFGAASSRARAAGVLPPADGFPAGLRGLNNLGNTCFMNSVLQVFLHSPLMRNYFLGQGHSQAECTRHGKAGGGGAGRPCLSCEMDAVFTAAYSGDRAPLSPTDFLYSWWTFADSLAGYQQQDAHEFYLSALSGLTSALIAPPPAPQPPPLPPPPPSVKVEAGSEAVMASGDVVGQLQVKWEQEGAGALGAFATSDESGSGSGREARDSASPTGGSHYGSALGANRAAGPGTGGAMDGPAAALGVQLLPVPHVDCGQEDAPAGTTPQQGGSTVAQAAVGTGVGASAGGGVTGEAGGGGAGPGGNGGGPAPGLSLDPLLSLVDCVFGGVLRSDVTCCVCGHTSTAFDPFLDISLDMVAYGAALPHRGGAAGMGGVPAPSSTPTPAATASLTLADPDRAARTNTEADGETEAGGVSPGGGRGTPARPSVSACGGGGGLSSQSVSLRQLGQGQGSGSQSPTGTTGGTALGDEEEEDCPSPSTGSGSGPGEGARGARGGRLRTRGGGSSGSASEESRGPRRGRDSASLSARDGDGGRDGDGDQLMAEQEEGAEGRAATEMRAPTSHSPRGGRRRGGGGGAGGAASPPVGVRMTVAGASGHGSRAAAAGDDVPPGRRAPTPCTADAPGPDGGDTVPPEDAASPRGLGRGWSDANPSAPVGAGLVAAGNGAAAAAHHAMGPQHHPAPRQQRSPRKECATEMGADAAAGVPLVRTTSDSMAAAESAAEGGGGLAVAAGADDDEEDEDAAVEAGAGTADGRPRDSCITSPRAAVGQVGGGGAARGVGRSSNQLIAVDLVQLEAGAVAGARGVRPHGQVAGSCGTHQRDGRRASYTGGDSGGDAGNADCGAIEPQASAAAEGADEAAGGEGEANPGSRGVTPGVSGSCVEDANGTAAAAEQEGAGLRAAGAGEMEADMQGQQEGLQEQQRRQSGEDGPGAAVGPRRVGIVAGRGRGRSGSRGRRVGGPGARPLSGAAAAGAARRAAGSIPQMGQAGASAAAMVDPRLAARGSRAREGRAGSDGAGGAQQAGPGPGASGGSTTLVACLRHFVTPEQLSAAEAWVCSACQRRQPAVKQLSIRRLPPVLALHVKRFEHRHHHHHHHYPQHAAQHQPDRLQRPHASQQKADRGPAGQLGGGGSQSLGGGGGGHGYGHVAGGGSSRSGRHMARKIQTQLQFPLQLDLAPYTSGAVLRSRYAVRQGPDAAASVEKVEGELPPQHPVQPDAEAATPPASGAVTAAGAAPCAPSCSYRLFAVISHKGDLSGGHYVVFVRPQQQQPGAAAGGWYQCDDAWVTAVSEEDVVGCQAYMLFYAAEASQQQPQQERKVDAEGKPAGGVMGRDGQG